MYALAHGYILHDFVNAHISYSLSLSSYITIIIQGPTGPLGSPGTVGREGAKGFRGRDARPGSSGESGRQVSST